MSVVSLGREWAIKKLAEKAKKGELNTRELSELDLIVQNSVTIENLVGRGFLNPANIDNPAQIKRATTEFLKSLYGNPMAKRYEKLRDGVSDRVAYQDTPFQERRVISPEELNEGNYVLVPNISDQTVANRTVTKVGGIELDEPINIGGGVDFTQVNADTPLGWASNKDAARSQQNQFDYVYDQTGGRTPIAVNTFLTPESNTFNDAYANAFMQIANKIQIPKKIADKFDDAVRAGKFSINKEGEKVYTIKPFPKWVGINHPDARNQLLGREGYQNIGGNRQSVLFTAFQPEYKVMGMPSINEFHEVFKLPENFERGSAGYNMYKPEVGADIQNYSNNTAYDSGIIGEPFGQIEGRAAPPEIFFPDIIEDYLARGKSMSDAIGAFMMNPKLMQIPTKEWTSGMRSWINQNPSKAKDTAKALAGFGVPATVIAAATGYTEDVEAGAVGTAKKAASSYWVGKPVDEIVKAGYPLEVAKRISSGELPMDEASRSARRDAFGNKMYRGLGEAYQEGKGTNATTWATPDPTFASGYAIENAEKLVDPAANVMPVRVKSENPLDLGFRTSFTEVKPDNIANRVSTRIQEAFAEGKITREEAIKADDAIWDWYENLHDLDKQAFRPVFSYWNKDKDFVDALKKAGFDSIKDAEVSAGSWGSLSDTPDVKTLGVLDDANIRSDNAAFDPEYTGPNILGSRIAPTVATGLVGGAGLYTALKSNKVMANPVDDYTGGVTDYQERAGAGTYGVMQSDQAEAGEMPWLDEAPRQKTAADMMDQTQREFDQSVMDPYYFDTNEVERTSVGDYVKDVADIWGSMGRGMLTGLTGTFGDIETLLAGGLIPGIIRAAKGDGFIDSAMGGLATYDSYMPTAEDMREYIPALPQMGDTSASDMEMALNIGEILAPEPGQPLKLMRSAVPFSPGMLMRPVTP